MISWFAVLSSDSYVFKMQTVKKDIMYYSLYYPESWGSGSLKQAFKCADNFFSEISSNS